MISKWVYKTKFKQDSTVERLKARLVIRGIHQKEGRDYKLTFSPVAKLAMIRVLIALATAKEWPLHQLDINAFLHGYLGEDIYMVPPKGYDMAKPGEVYKLKRSMYGLKQASCQWNQELTKFLLSSGYVQSKHDYSLFVKYDGYKFTTALVYVDAMLLTGNCEAEMLATKGALDNQLTIKDLGLAHYFLGIELCRTDSGTFFNQRKYILDLLSDAGLIESKPVAFPLPQGTTLSADQGKLLDNPNTYKRLIGRLLYLTMIRSEVSYAIQHLSQFVAFPRDTHMQAATHVLRYVKGSISKGPFYPIQSDLKFT